MVGLELVSVLKWLMTSQTFQLPYIYEYIQRQNNRNEQLSQNDSQFSRILVRTNLFFTLFHSQMDQLVSLQHNPPK